MFIKWGKGFLYKLNICFRVGRNKNQHLPCKEISSTNVGKWDLNSMREDDNEAREEMQVRQRLCGETRGAASFLPYQQVQVRRVHVWEGVMAWRGNGPMRTSKGVSYDTGLPTEGTLGRYCNHIVAIATIAKACLWCCIHFKSITKWKCCFYYARTLMEILLFWNSGTDNLKDNKPMYIFKQNNLLMWGHTSLHQSCFELFNVLWINHCYNVMSPIWQQEDWKCFLHSKLPR